MNKIKLDCTAGRARPDTHLPFILEGTGIPVKERTEAFFGEWVWEYPEIPTEEWDIACSTIMKRIRLLHSQGIIRFGGCE